MDYIPLRMSASGPAVRQVQRMLLQLGYPVGKADGKFGVRTLRAVIAFQSDHELPVDGIVAANTWMALEKRTGGSLEPEVEEAWPTLSVAEPRPLPLIPPEPPMREPPSPPAPPMPPVAPPPPAEAVQPPVPIMPPIDWSPALPEVAAESVPQAPSPVPTPGRPWTKIAP